jgi:glycine betaine/proline transport system ATP-binding protein
MNAAVEFKNVDIVFGDDTARALEMIDEGASRADILARTGAVLGCAGCNLTVNEGEISVLMGLSGSGQSTLLRAVNLLNVPARGNVLVKQGEGMVDVTGCNATTLRSIRQKQVAMVFQQFALLPWRTVEENVGLGLELAGMPEAERKAKVGKQLDLVNLTPWSRSRLSRMTFQAVSTESGFTLAMNSRT